MSWMKRGQAGAGAGAGAQPYAAAPQAQHFENQQNMYPNYQGGTGPAPSQPQQQYWQQPPQQSPQVPPQQQFNHGQHYSQPYPPNANQYQQPTHTPYNQNYANQYANPQQNYQQQYYQTQPAQHAYTQNVSNAANTDGWEDNWDWGWEENAKKAQSLQNQQPPVQQSVFNNANVIEESFASTDSWNWAMDEKKENKVPVAMPPPRQENNVPASLPTRSLENNVLPEPAQNNILNPQVEEVKTLSDREVIKERLPNLALGKRFHIENLTPQWSIESQMSQESSDGPHTQSEGTYRSENQSRNSGESPVPNTDNSNFNYTQPGFDETYTQNSEWSKNSDEPTVADGSRHSRRESHEELANSLQEMSIANDHNSTNTILSTHAGVDSRGVQEHLSTRQPPSFSPENFPVPITGSSSVPALSVPPSPPLSAAGAQLAPQASLPRPTPASTSPLGHAWQTAGALAGPARPPPTSSPATLPPSLPPPANSQNPFQRAGPFSHKSTTKPPSGPGQLCQPQISNSNLTSPTAVNKVSQGRGSVGFEANLESAPDNSERPDQPQLVFRAMPMPQPVPDNMEVAPQNDRNEYLQTAHLSSGDYGENQNTDFTRNLPPPPGLRRMVVGQQEAEYQNLNISGDEPPPGLARMVPGQQTEEDNAYNQPSDNYMDRHIDGQPMDDAGSARPFRQADGQQNPDNYSQPVTGRAGDRRPVGFDRMVPGEPSNDEYPQYQGSNYATNEQRVVTGLDRDFPIRIEANPSDVREQNMDGSDYTEPAPRNVLGVREPNNDMTQDFAAPDETQREVTMEGENLQDLSAISSADLTYSREHLDGADQNVTDAGTDRNDASDSLDRPAANSRKQSLNRVHSSGEESERDRAFKSSPRRDRHKTSRDRDRDRNREREKEGRYSRGDKSGRNYERDGDRRRGDKRADKERRKREDAASPDARKPRRAARGRNHDDDDTDYYSDRERDRRRYREGSYTSKPPRPEGDRRYDDRRYNTVERERRDRDRPRDSTRRDRDRYERHYADYRDIDPSRKYGNLHREREEERRRVTFSTDAKSNDCKSEGDALSSASRPESREAAATDEEARTRRSTRRPRHHRTDPYYDGYGGGAGVGGVGGGGYVDPYLAQRQQYEYYEQLRVTDPAAYLVLYKQLMARSVPRELARHNPHVATEAYPSMGYEGQERGSVHSGRSSTTGLKGNDTFYVYRHEAASLRDAPSLRTDVSDRDLNTEASLGLQLEESTVRSERMTPYRFSTAHVKCSIGSRDMVVVPAAYPVDGRPATVQVVSLAGVRAHDADAAALAHSPGPLVKDVTHKKSVIEYCLSRARAAAREGARDVIGYALLWDLLALMLRQNGVVVGTDIAELLIKSASEREARGRGSSLSGELHDADDTNNSSCPPHSDNHNHHHQHQHDYSLSEAVGGESLGSPCVDETAALDKYREYLLYGNRQEALEWAMSNNLWGHALQLAMSGERRVRAAVSARFLAAIPRADPLHTLYATRNNSSHPHAPTCLWEDGAWRAHAGMLLANASARPDHDAKTLIALGDGLSSRGLIYSAQFCYVCAGEPFARHPLAPLGPGPAPAAVPRLALLLAEARPGTLQQLATARAILATEIYEYARSLNADYVITELQVYKLMTACRLVDAGQYARALAYVEAAARAVTRQPRLYSRALVSALADLADRLKYHDPALSPGGAGAGAGAAEGEGAEGEGPDSGEGSPRHHQWLDDVITLAHTLQVQSASQQQTPQHHYTEHNQQQAAWGDQAQQYQQTPNQTFVEPEETADYSQYYQPLPMPVPPSETASDHTSPYPPQPEQPGPYHVDQPGPYPAQVNQPSFPSPPADLLVPPGGGGGGGGQEDGSYHYEDWSRTEETHSQSYGDPYWQGDNYNYGEGGGSASVVRRRAPPRPRAAPLAPALAAAGGRAPDAFELCELRPSLRRRVHPAPPRALPGPAFTAPLAPAPAPTSHPRPSEAPRQQLSDLDIQIAHSGPAGGVAGSPCGRGPQGAPPAAAYGAGRVAGCGRLISSTVDTWSQRAGPHAAYKPLVFGGTYPIEVPTSPQAAPLPHPVPEGRGGGGEGVILDKEEHKRELRRTIERSLNKFEAILSRRGPPPAALPPAGRAVRTFDIDAPLGAGAPPAPPAPRPDAAYYVAGPKTYDIDKPY